ncbi:MAG TPA: cytochrome c [Burkholderiales bacterium]|nr:cytochrome c [Burkholderiales bacterium]
MQGVTVGVDRALAGAIGVLAAASLLAAEPVIPRQAELTHLVRQDCGSCHGMTLKGGLGPALTREALREKPAESLVVTVLYGRPGTAMPPWRDFVSEPEAAWIVKQLQEGTLSER